MNLDELPGAELILPGVEDLRRGQTDTVGALLIAILRRRGFANAFTRLTNAGLAIPKTNLTPEPELTLYAQLENERDDAYPYYDDAYPYYNALLDSLSSFCNALELKSQIDCSEKPDAPTPTANPSLAL